jgi:hypothetical protein
MRYKTQFFCLAVMAGFSLCMQAEMLQLRGPKTLTSSSGNLMPGTYATPFVDDWNGDGLKDLLIGYQNVGKIAVYLNCGTDAKPAFTNGFNLRFLDLSTDTWRDITHPSGGCGAPAPWVCDFDADGKKDLLVGEGQEGMVLFYRNTNTDSTPILVSPVQLKAGGVTMKVGSRANPVLHDWDEDGLPDLICGAGDGHVYFFRNTNTVKSPNFAPAVKIRAGGVDLLVNQIVEGGTSPTPRSVPRVIDWDGDGLKDLVCSSDSGVFWCRNTNSNPEPILQAPVRLFAPGPGGLTPIVTAIVPGARMRVCPVDWNNDGVLDLLLGNADGTTYYYEGYHFGFTSLSCGNSDQLSLQWNSADQLTYNVLGGTSPDSITEVLATNVPSGGTATCWTNTMTAGAPQLFRVQIAR